MLDSIIANPIEIYDRLVRSEVEADAKMAAEAALHNVVEGAQRDIFSVILHLRDKGTLLVNALGKLFLSQVQLLAGALDLEAYSERLKFILKTVAFGSADSAVILSLNLIESLYVFHHSLSFSL